MKLTSIEAAVLLGCTLQYASGQYLLCGPESSTLSLAGLAPPGGQLGLADVSGAHVTFKYSGTEDYYGKLVPDSLNPFVVFPASGTTPAILWVGLNPAVVPFYSPYIPQGSPYNFAVVFTSPDEPPSSLPPTRCGVAIAVPNEPAPSIQSVVNAASLQPLLSPGAMVSIFGSHLTGPTLSANYDFTAAYPTSVASTSVTFNGIAAPLLYVSPSQINAIVPFALAGQTSVQVVVQRFNQFSTAITLPLWDTSPAIFTAAQNGSGPGAILQQGAGGQFTYNSSANPAPRGAALEIFATGMGMWTPAPQSDVAFYGGTFTAQPVSVTIGGQPAKILYAGRMGGLTSWSVLQANAVVPNGIGSGSQTVVLKVGANDNSQQGVTLSVQ